MPKFTCKYSTIEFELIDSKGNTHTGSNLSEFCELHGLDTRQVYRMITGTASTNSKRVLSVKGWKTPETVNSVRAPRTRKQAPKRTETQQAQINAQLGSFKPTGTRDLPTGNYHTDTAPRPCGNEHDEFVEELLADAPWRQ